MQYKITLNEREMIKLISMEYDLIKVNVGIHLKLRYTWIS